MPLGVHAKIFFDQSLANTSDAEIEACTRGMKDGQTLKIYYEEASLTITSENPRYEVRPYNSRIASYFKTVVKDASIHSSVTLKNFFWGVWNNTKCLIHDEMATVEIKVPAWWKPFIWEHGTNERGNLLTSKTSFPLDERKELNGKQRAFFESFSHKKKPDAGFQRT